jgi:hypothetical protein
MEQRAVTPDRDEQVGVLDQGIPLAPDNVILRHLASALGVQ